MLLTTIPKNVSLNNKNIYNIDYRNVGLNVKILIKKLPCHCGYYSLHSESKIIIFIITSPSRILFTI